MFITTDTLHIWLALFPLPLPHHVHWLLLERSMYFQHMCPAELASPFLQGAMDFNHLYRHVGSAQSLQQATVHGDGQVTEKCHSNSAVKKGGKGASKDGSNQGEYYRGKWNTWEMRNTSLQNKWRSTAPDRCECGHGCLMIVCTPPIWFRSYP